MFRPLLLSFLLTGCSAPACLLGDAADEIEILTASSVVEFGPKTRTTTVVCRKAG